MKAYDIKK